MYLFCITTNRNQFHFLKTFSNKQQQYKNTAFRRRTREMGGSPPLKKDGDTHRTFKRVKRGFWDFECSDSKGLQRQLPSYIHIETQQNDRRQSSNVWFQNQYLLGVKDLFKPRPQNRYHILVSVLKISCVFISKRLCKERNANLFFLQSLIFLFLVFVVFSISFFIAWSDFKALKLQK